MLVACSPQLANIDLELEFEDINDAYIGLKPDLIEALETFAKRSPSKGKEPSRHWSPSPSRILLPNVHILVARDTRDIRRPESAVSTVSWRTLDVEWRAVESTLKQNYTKFVKSRLPVCEERGVLRVNVRFRLLYFNSPHAT